MIRLAKSVILVLIVAGLHGCAGPRYQTLYRYEPPADPAARACLVRCEQGQTRCSEDCRERYEACSAAVEPEARTLHADALKRYEGERTRYQRDIDRYNLSISLGWGRGPGWYGAGWYDPWWPYHGFYGPRYYPPRPPRQPDYADALNSIREQRCERDCGCQSDYDACFLSCGGSKVPEVRCIANCPPEAR